MKDLIADILKLSEGWKEEWNSLEQTRIPIVLFGAGSTSDYILKEFRGRGVEPACFCDNDEKKRNQKIGGLDVLPLSDVITKYENCLFYITTQLYYSVIKKQLLDMGVSEDRIVKYDLICQFEWEKDYLQFVKNHQIELNEFINEVADEKSRETIVARLSFLITRERDYACRVRSKVQYFEEDILDYQKLKAFVDVGVYTGDSIQEFLKYNDLSECVVYGFEMDEKLYELAKKSSENLGDKVKLFKMAVSDKDGIGHLTGKLGVMQSIESGTFSEKEQEIMFEICKLDTVLPELMSGAFLKMDIEGAELSAIKGGENFIKNNHPMMAICIYHKGDDIIEIPKKIKSCY